MKRMFAVLAGLGTLVLAGPALSQEAPAAAAAEVCRVASPQVPAVDWRGVAAYRARSTVKDGRVVQLEITALTSGVERRAQRSLVMAIQQALRAAPCQPGDHVFEQEFSFDLRQAPAPAPSASQGT
jgi:hypothetical protein